LIIAIANEFDLVPRADQAYIRSLIDLYRSVYGLAPAMDGAIGMESINQSSTYVDSEISSYTLPPLYFEEVTERMKNKTTNRLDNCWKLPLPDYHLIGDIVILRKEDASERVAGEAEAEVKGVDIREKSPRQIVRALSVPQEEFARFLFCGIETHRRIYYNERIDLVARGEFNCRNGWEIE
jgi:hypothetical protein